MTVSASTAKYVYTGDGVSVAFPFPSLVLASGDVLVGLNGVQQTTGYAVSGVNSPDGATVTFTAPPAAGVIVLLLRKPTFQQLVDFVTGQTVLEGTIETALDRLTMMAQYLLDANSRTLRVPDLDTSTSTEDLQVPPAAVRASKAIGFDAAGNVTLYTLGGEGGGGGGVAGVSLFNGRSGNVFPEADDYAAAQVTNAARTNDANTFTGDQTIAKANPTLTLNKAASGQANTLRGLRNNVLRWALRLGNATPEAGANAGSDYEEVSADDAGTETVRGRIRRSDGYRWIFGNLEIGLPDLGHWLTLRRRGAASGGRIDLERGASGNALASDVRIALEGNLLQIGETGGTQRGCSIDITALAAAFGTPLASTGANVQIFTATGPGTWTKPALLTGNEFVLALVWAAGGGGTNGFGGGGGGFKWGFYRASDLNATEALSVGAGGAAASQGGNSTFKNMTAFGGAGAGGTFGGGGGGMQGAGSSVTGGGPLFGAGGVPPGASVAGGGGGAGNSGGTIGGASVFGGGGGGASAGAGGASVFGGGGGSGSGAGGTSDFGGAGGTGANAGAAPGGGGGGTNAAGGRGEIRIYTFR